MSRGVGSDGVLGQMQLHTPAAPAQVSPAWVYYGCKSMAAGNQYECPPCSRRASMGGMVAQELGALLLHRQRLASLTLAVTCRGMRPALGLLGHVLIQKEKHI